jgi:hypothetical protein
MKHCFIEINRCTTKTITEERDFYKINFEIVPH